MLLGACQPGESASEPAAPVAEEVAAAKPAAADDTAAFDGIGADETVHFTGTEPFWGGEVHGTTLRYNTPENIDGTEIAVERFAGRGGLSYSGQLEGAAFEMMLTPLESGDGLSEIVYPFTVTVKIGEDTREGCGWTDRQPRDESKNQ
jgi:uncharacterized membrane protein